LMEGAARAALSRGPVTAQTWCAGWIGFFPERVQHADRGSSRGWPAAASSATAPRRSRRTSTSRYCPATRP